MPRYFADKDLHEAPDGTGLAPPNGGGFMNKNSVQPKDKKFKKEAAEPMSPDESFDGNLTAQPKGFAGGQDLQEDDIAASLEYGEMNLKDAMDSGYTDEDEKAISQTVPDIEGSPTGAFTDIGAGRSSAVRPHH